MWTYFLILLSAIGLIIIFSRRAYLVYKKAQKKPEVVEEIPEEETQKKRLSSENKAKIIELCESAEANLKAGKEDEAIKSLVQALAIDELNLEAQHKLAMLYMQKQMFSTAAALFRKLGELTNDPVHFSHLGLALFNQAEYEGAKDAYQQAVTLDPGRPQRFASLAQVYRALGQYQNAIISLNKALEVDKENFDFLFLLASIQKEAGNLEEAKQVLEQMGGIDPKNKDIKQFLKEIEGVTKEKAEGKGLMR